ncbi:hypothetical protein, partial [Helicobacter sp. T3_23-1059]
MREIGSFADRLTTLTAQDIDNLNKNSHIAYLKALYECQSFILVDSSHTPSLNDDNVISHFGYHSSFYLSFIANKESLSDSYLTSRKVLYKSIMQIKEEQKQELDSLEKELQDLDFNQREERLKEIQRGQEKKARESKLNRFDRKSDSINDLILQTNDKTSTIIFLDSLNSKISMSNLIHIYNKNNQTKIDIFTKDRTIIDIYELAKKYSDYGINLDLLHSANTQIFFYSILLQCGSESSLPHNECFFGSLDSKDSQNPNFNVSNANRNASDSNALDSNLSANDSNLANTDSANDLDESKPIYYLEYDEADLDSSDSNKSYKSNVDSNHSNDSNNSTNTNNSTQTNNTTKIYPTNQTLQIFLNNHKLTILNYSILDSS